MLVNQSNRIANAAGRVNWKSVGQWAIIAMILVSPVVLASGDEGLKDATTRACDFFGRINGILNIASVAVVTIAVVFAGYQVAFAHKRITDVAPVLIGGLLIGGAAQIAGMLIGKDSTDCKATSYVTPIVETRNA